MLAADHVRAGAWGGGLEGWARVGEKYWDFGGQRGVAEETGRQRGMIWSAHAADLAADQGPSGGRRGYPDNWGKRGELKP